MSARATIHVVMAVAFMLVGGLALYMGDADGVRFDFLAAMLWAATMPRRDP